MTKKQMEELKKEINENYGLATIQRILFFLLLLVAVTNHR